MATSEKIQLKGASQYKKDLQQIVAESKALASEMNLVKSSFDKSTSSEKRYEAVSAQLTKQIETQKRYVEQLTKAYEAEVAKSGERSTAALKVKDALNKAQSTLNNMEKENAELAEAEKNETAAAKENTSAHEKLNGVLKVGLAAIGTIAASTAAAAKALWDCTNAAGQWADNLLTLSQQSGASVDTLQKWDYAARFIDTDSETMVKALGKVAKMQASSIKSGDEYVTMLDGQTIALRNSNGELKSNEDLLMNMVDALGSIADDTVREAAAQELFGKSFQEMMPLINAGSEGLKKYGDEAEALGLVLSGDAVNSLGEFDDQMQRLKATIEVAGKQLALSFLPATKEVADQLTELAQTVTKALADGFQEADVDTILNALFDKISKGMSNISTMMPAVARFMTGLVNKLVEFVTQNLPMLAQVGLQIITGLVTGISQNLPVLMPAVVECIMTIAQTLMAPENVSMVMDAAVALMQGLGQGLINATPVLIQMLPQLVSNMVQSLITQAPQMYQLGPEFVSQFSLGMVEAIGGMANQLKSWITEKIVNVAKSMASKMSPAGQALVEGLWNGISDKMDWIKSKIKTWVGNVLDFFKNLLGIHSPSTVFEGYGENMAEGLAIGYMNGIGYIKSALGMTPGLALDAGPAMGGVTLYIDGIKYNTDEYVDSSITNFVESMVRRSQMYGR